MHQQCSSCWVFCLEASRGMPISLYPATEVFFAKTGNGQTAISANMPPSGIFFLFVLNVSSQNHVCKLDYAGELFD